MIPTSLNVSSVGLILDSKIHDNLTADSGSAIIPSFLASMSTPSRGVDNRVRGITKPYTHSKAWGGTMRGL